MAGFPLVSIQDPGRAVAPRPTPPTDPSDCSFRRLGGAAAALRGGGAAPGAAAAPGAPEAETEIRTSPRQKRRPSEIGHRKSGRRLVRNGGRGNVAGTLNRTSGTRRRRAGGGFGVGNGNGNRRSEETVAVVSTRPGKNGSFPKKPTPKADFPKKTTPKADFRKPSARSKRSETGGLGGNVFGGRWFEETEVETAARLQNSMCRSGQKRKSRKPSVVRKEVKRAVVGATRRNKSVCRSGQKWSGKIGDWFCRIVLDGFVQSYCGWLQNPLRSPPFSNPGF